MTAALHTFAASGPVSDFTRAQLLLNRHIAQIDAALGQLRLHRATMLPTMADMHDAKLNGFRKALIRDLHDTLNCPDGAFIYIGRWNENGFAPNIMDACEAVDHSIGRRNAYRDMLAARRGGLAVVR